MPYLLVDGYNIVFAQKELTAMAEYSLEGARRKLCDILCEYKAMTAYNIIVVFDAHLVEGGVGCVETYQNIMVVFTKEAETADHYIEYTAQRLKRHDKVVVATSDRLEQIIIIGQGARRISAPDLWAEIEQTRKEMRERYLSSQPVKKNPIAALLDEETARLLDEMRYGNETQASHEITHSHKTQNNNGKPNKKEKRNNKGKPNKKETQNSRPNKP